MQSGVMFPPGLLSLLSRPGLSPPRCWDRKKSDCKKKLNKNNNKNLSSKKSNVKSAPSRPTHTAKDRTIFEFYSELEILTQSSTAWPFHFLYGSDWLRQWSKYFAVTKDIVFLCCFCSWQFQCLNPWQQKETQKSPWIFWLFSWQFDWMYCFISSVGSACFALIVV